MGCDIHAYIDYDKKVRGENYVHSLAEFMIDRNYLLFTVLAGVRDDMLNPIGPVVEPKGLPTELSFKTRFDVSLFVSENDDEDSNDEHTCQKSKAKRFASYNQHLGFGGYLDEAKRWVFHPDWHDHSWLTIEELEASLKKYSAVAKKKNWENKKVPSDIKALLATMKALKKDGLEPRFVFWFDN